MNPDILEQLHRAAVADRGMMRGKLALFAAPFLIAVIVLTLVSSSALESLKVDGPVYRAVLLMKDLEAEILSPPLDLTAFYLLILRMVDESDPKEVRALIEQGRVARDAYESRQAYWIATLPDGEAKKRLVEQVQREAEAFFLTVERAFLPSLLSGEPTEARRLAHHALNRDYQRHRAAVGELADIVTPLRKAVNEYATDSVERQRRNLLLWALALLSLTVAVGGFSAVLFSRHLTQRAASMATWLVEEVAEDRPRNEHTDGSEDAAALSAGFERVLEQLRRMTGTVSKISNQLALAWSELAVSIGPMAQETAIRIAHSAEQFPRPVDTTPATASGVIPLVSTVAPAPSKATEQPDPDQAERPSEILADLQRSSAHITEIVGIIQGLADHTNQLVEKAAREASRADEQGQSLAILTEQVRALAERTTRATEDVRETIRQLQQETLGAFAGIEEGSDKVAGGLELVRKTGDALAAIAERVKRVADTIREIAQTEEADAAESLRTGANKPTATGTGQESVPPSGGIIKASSPT